MGRSSCSASCLPIASRPLVVRTCAALLLLLLFSLGLGAGPVAAQIRINEIFPNPVGADETGLEWIEIYNAGAAPVNMTGWAIDDAVTIGQVAVRARIPEDLDATCSTSAIIGPGEFRVVRPTATSINLNNTGDDVYLVSDRLMNATVVQLVTYPATAANEGQSWGCIPNGSTDPITFAFRNPATKCATNGDATDVTPPGTVNDLAAVPGLYPGEIRLTWTAPGDDGASGTASSYIIKVSHTAITAGTFDASADIDRWIGEALPHAGGTPETLFVFGLDPDSTWFFALKTQDEKPNTSAISNSPGTSPLAGMRLDPNLGYTPYFGNLHSHTSYSDGVQTPPQAYDYARNGAPTALDFLAVTDHNHADLGNTPALYAQGLAEAAAANSDGNFVAIWGQEWGIISTGGHANVFEAPVLFGWDAGNYDVFVGQTDYTGLYTAYLANPPANFPPIVEWCHPATGDFNSYAVTNDGKAVVHLMNMINGPAFSTSTTESDVGSTTGNEILWQDALRRGYRVSPTGDQDNHNATWGASTQTRTAVLASGLTKNQIMSSLADRRCYATQDHNTEVQFSADGRAMGTAWTSGAGIRFAAKIIDPDLGDAVTQIDLLRGITGVSNAAVVASSADNPNFAWRERTTFPPGTEAHYYLRIRMSSNATIWTGPVYVTYDPSGVTAVDDAPRGSTFQMAVGPNPSLGRVTASFTLPRESRRTDLAVYDASGRHVKTLLGGPLAAGTHAITWTGLDEGNRPTPSGIFFLRLRTEEHSVVRKVLLVR